MQARIDQLAELVKGLPAEGEVGSAVEIAADSAQALTAARAELGSAVASRAERESELAALIAKTGDRQKILSFERLVVQQEEQAGSATRCAQAVERGRANVDRAETALVAGSQTAERASVAVKAADDDLAAATQLLTAAQAALLDAQHAEMALELRSTLTSEEPCPVCRQPVHKLPPKGAAPKVGAAQRAVSAANKAQDKARRAKEAAVAARAAAEAGSAEAAKTLEHVVEDLRRSEVELKAAEAELASTKAQLTEWLGEGDARSLLQMRADELAAAEDALATSSSAVEAAREATDLAVAAQTSAASTLARLANQLAGTWGRLGHTRQIAAEDAGSAYLELGEAIVTANDEAVKGLAAARTATQAATESKSALMEGAGLSAGQDFRSALNQAEVEHRSASVRVAELEQRVATGSQLKTQIEEGRRNKEIAARLAEDLKPSRFLAFLLEEERTELAELGSEHFELLTDGGFRFAEGGDFDIADLDAAGAVRKADSLSGGETFIASLALALALAQMVARSGGSLDSFFLDEGFGSLDPEHLDRAMEGISRLVAADDRRLVVVVSHVSEMREAIEDLIVLDKHPVTGDSVVRSGARPEDTRT
jgi:exonuclease SbcC